MSNLQLGLKESEVIVDESGDAEMDQGEIMALGKTLPKCDPGDVKAYLRNNAAHNAGISHEEMVASYTAWADNYDVDLCPGRYNGPSIAAIAMAEHYPCEVTRGVLRVLDVAAGTGRVGQELDKIGFKHIDALEPSEGMLKILKGREVYESTFQNSIGILKIEVIPAGSYDCLVIAGGMGEGHIPVFACDEMIRIVKPGGTIFIVMREEYLREVKEYANKLEPYMKTLEDQGLWKQVGRDVVKNYSFNKNGVVFKYEVA